MSKGEQMEGITIKTNGRPHGTKKENVKKEKIVIYVLSSEKARLEKEASIAGYTLNVYLREKLKRG